MFTKCSKCHQLVRGDEQYHIKQAVVCETCYMENRKHYARKTHWRYIRSIKVDYLQPAKKIDE
jgi:hypothetical protein